MNVDYEAYVRAAWERVHVSDWYAETSCAIEALSIRLPCNWTSRVGATATDEGMWKQTYEFTLQRQEEIRQVDAEIATLEGYLPLGSITDTDSAIIHAFEDVLPIRAITEDQVRLSRTIDRLQSIRAELQKGMKQ